MRLTSVIVNFDRLATATDVGQESYRSIACANVNELSVSALTHAERVLCRMVEDLRDSDRIGDISNHPQGAPLFG